MPSRLRLAAVALFAAAPLLSQSDSSGKESRSVRVDEGISVRVPPLFSTRSFEKGTTRLELTVSEGPVLRSVVYVTVEKRRSPQDALQRAAEISGPPSPDDRLFLVSGWPAVEATRTIELPRVMRDQEAAPPAKPGEEKPAESAAGTERQVTTFDRTMTAIAAGDRTVIVEQRLFDRSDPRLREGGRAVVDGITFTRGGVEERSRKALDEITFVRTRLFSTKDILDLPPGDFGFLFEASVSPALGVQQGQGEVAMAASWDGAKIALATNSGWGRSLDSGATFTGGNAFPASIPNQGDPSLAYGGRTGAFYLGYLGRPNGGGGAGNTQNGCTVSVDRSTDGKNYAFAGQVTFCAASQTPGQLMCAPDQEMVAAYPVRSRIRGRRPGQSLPQDEVYVAWRQFTATATKAVNTCAGLNQGSVVVAISCSKDSGATWTGPLLLATGSDFGRVAVGPDGSLYVLYAVLQTDSGGTTWNQLYLDKYSSCSTGLVHQWGYPRTVVANAKPASCNGTVPGVDRCDGQVMNSHTVAVSGFDSKGLVFIVYTDGTYDTSTLKGTDRVIGAIAPNGGFNVTATHLLSDGSAGRKFLPWACAEGKHLYATWYDRRAATKAAPDATDYFAGWLSLDQFGIGEHTNLNLTGNSDPQCNSGWPFGTTVPANATSCPTHQVTAGLCLNAAGTQNGTCDFSPRISPINGSKIGACPSGFTCSPGPGAPKYGDYNANACAAGKLFAAWTSATTPTGSAAAAVGLTTFTRTITPKQ